MGVFAYTELTSRLVSLETSRELFENDLLKKSEQVPTDQEQHFLIEDLYKTVEKMERVTRKIVQYLEDMEKKAKQMSFTKNLKKEVETGKHGTQKYVLKQGPNKGKIV